MYSNFFLTPLLYRLLRRRRVLSFLFLCSWFEHVVDVVGPGADDTNGDASDGNRHTDTNSAVHGMTSRT